MSELIKGNFKTKHSVTDQAESPTLEDEFEMKALKRLGGSITFVAKRKVTWDLPAQPDAKKHR